MALHMFLLQTHVDFFEGHAASIFFHSSSRGYKKVESLLFTHLRTSSEAFSWTLAELKLQRKNKWPIIFLKKLKITLYLTFQMQFKKIFLFDCNNWKMHVQN